MTRPLLPEVVAGPTAELQAGKFSEAAVFPTLDALSARTGLVPYSDESFRTLLCVGLSSPGAGELAFALAGELLNGWKPFIADVGKSSIRRLDFRRLGGGATQRAQISGHFRK